MHYNFVFRVFVRRILKKKCVKKCFEGDLVIAEKKETKCNRDILCQV